MSVCLSVTCQYSVETAQQIIKLFSPLGSHITLVFAVPNVMLFRWGCPNGGVEYTGVWKIAIFGQYLTIYIWNDTRYGHNYCGMQIGNCTQTFDWDLRWTGRKCSRLWTAARLNPSFHHSSLPSSHSWWGLCLRGALINSSTQSSVAPWWSSFTWTTVDV